MTKLWERMVARLRRVTGSKAKDGRAARAVARAELDADPNHVSEENERAGRRYFR